MNKRISYVTLISDIYILLVDLIVAYLLHKCNYIKVRIILIVLCILNIIYRTINLLHMVNPLTLLMIFINIVLFIILLLYKKIKICSLIPEEADRPHFCLF